MTTSDKEKIIKIKKDRYKEIEKVSESISIGTRNLAIAGISASWILINFTLSQDLNDLLKHKAVISVFLFVCAIFGEFLHLLIQCFVTVLYSTVFLYEEKEGNVRINNIPSWAKWCTWIIWVAKILCMLIGYLYLFSIIQNL